MSELLEEIVDKYDCVAEHRGLGLMQGIELVNEKFGGSQYISLLFEGDVLAPETLNRLDSYTKQIEQLPEAGHVISPSTFFP